jgi:hypothetical protein
VIKRTLKGKSHVVVPALWLVAAACAALAALDQFGPWRLGIALLNLSLAIIFFVVLRPPAKVPTETRTLSDGSNMSNVASRQ